MGSGGWSSDVYRTAAKDRRARGEADFGHDKDFRSGRVASTHGDLDPSKMRNGIRESRDSAEHPRSRPIVVFFDVTGSMGGIPVALQAKLGGLMDTIIEKTSVKDPQFLVGAVGDAACDRCPLQVGQFESDNRIDEQLRKIVLEGGGGPYGEESYDLVFYLAAKRFETDAFEKRGEKGYLFLIADERPRPYVSAKEIKRVFGGQPDEDIRIEEVVRAAQKKFEIFLIVPQSLDNPRGHKEVWENLLDSQHIIPLKNPDLVCEVIAGVIDMLEGGKSAEAAAAEVVFRSGDRAAVASALVTVASVRLPAKTAKGGLPASHSTSSRRT